MEKEDAREGADSLKQLEVPFVDKDECFYEAPSDFKNFITIDKICAGWTNGKFKIVQVNSKETQHTKSGRVY